jgi:hypothetical protein
MKSDAPAHSRMPTFGRLFRWLFSWRTFGRVLILLAGLATVLALFYAEENWRGKRAWEKCKSELLAQGVELDWHKFIPPPVPDEQNFAMTPFLAPLFNFNPRPLQAGQTRWRDTNGFNRTTTFAGQFSAIESTHGWLHVQPGKLTDLEGCWRALQSSPTTNAAAFHNRAEAAVALMEALRQFNPVLAELYSASGRPSSRFNVDYTEEDPAAILIPHLSVINKAGYVLRFRASAELALGRNDAAFADAGLIIHLANSIRNDPFIISALARERILGMAVQIIWEGLGQHSWSDAQLREFQARLEDSSVLKQFSESMRAERASFGDGIFEYLRAHPSELRGMIDSSSTSLPAAILSYGPNGWLYQEQVSYQRLYDQKLPAGFDVDAGRFHPQDIEQWAKQLDLITGRGIIDQLRHHRLLSSLLFPNLTGLYQKTALAQNNLNQAAIACALERHRLAHGQYPETLDSLLPAFIGKLPLDVCSGQPLKYRREADGHFILYSIGWNERDDTGTVVKDKEHIDSTQGDWVWPPYPEK